MGSTDLDLSQATTTDLSGSVQDITVASAIPDTVGEDEEVWDFPDAAANLGLINASPELKAALRTHAIWVAGRGISVKNATDKVMIERWTGCGKDSMQEIMINMEFEKKGLGDSMAEIVKNDKGTKINLKPIWIGDMRVVFKKGGTIVRYVDRTTNKPYEPNQILHLINDRIGNEKHGNSVAAILKAVIEAKNEAMTDERKIRHRDLSLGVLYVNTQNPTKITAAVTAYQKSVKETEVLVLQEGTAKLEDPKITPRDRIAWLQYLDNYFYRIVGVPKVLVEAEGGEATSKVGYLSYDPIFTKDQVLLEQDLWNQMAIRVKFKRPASLAGVEQENEAKNTGQLGLQPNDVEASVERE